jgi:glycosyltransferase involved in cell wall biosynthesis
MKNQLHSIVVPVYQSRDILKVLVDRVSKVMNDAGLTFEMVLVDDGSQDGSFEKIKQLVALHKFIRGFKLSRNFGQQQTLIMGLRESRGDFVAIIDDDLQDPPEMLPKFFEILYEGADVAYGIRKGRKEGIIKKILYAAFYKTLSLLTNVEIPRHAGDFCAMRRRVVDIMLQFQEANPFLRGIRAWIGFKQVGVEYERAVRNKGKSGYTLRKYFNFAITGLVMFSYFPLRITTFLGILATAIAVLYVIVIILIWLFIIPFKVPGYLSLVVIITFLGGVQLISIGVIGEYIARLSDNVRKWPVAIVAEKTSEDE